jgi:hypothetical protein
MRGSAGLWTLAELMDSRALARFVLAVRGRRGASAHSPLDRRAEVCAEAS